MFAWMIGFALIGGGIYILKEENRGGKK